MDEVSQMGTVLVLFIFSIIVMCVYIRCIFALMDRDARIRELEAEKTQLISNVVEANELRKCDFESFRKAQELSSKDAHIHSAAMLELRSAYEKSIQRVRYLETYVTSLQDRMQYISDCTKSNFPIPARTNPIAPDDDE